MEPLEDVVGAAVVGPVARRQDDAHRQLDAADRAGPGGLLRAVADVVEGSLPGRGRDGIVGGCLRQGRDARGDLGARGQGFDDVADVAHVVHGPVDEQAPKHDDEHHRHTHHDGARRVAAHGPQRRAQRGAGESGGTVRAAGARGGRNSSRQKDRGDDGGQNGKDQHDCDRSEAGQRDAAQEAHVR